MRPKEALLLAFLFGCICKSLASCTTGYLRNKQGDCLLDTKECEKWGTCSQKCINTPGGFRCDCADGYYNDPTYATRCKVAGESPKLLLADGQDIMMVPLDKPHEVTILPNFPAVAFDYVWRSKTLVWSNGMGIKSALMDSPWNQTELLPATAKNEIVALAVDWIHSNVYWMDSKSKNVSVISLSGGSAEKLFHTSTSHDLLIGIAVDPFEGWLYFLIKNCKHGSSLGYIARGRLDGSDTSTVIGNLSCPSGITIDFTLHRLYWLDAHTARLESCKLDGTDRRVILEKSTSLQSPFSASVLEDFIYYSDRTSKSVFKVNKFNGTIVERILQTRREKILVHVHHEMRQPRGQNPCAGLSGCCVHLCLPGLSFNNQTATVTCVCANGIKMKFNRTLGTMVDTSTPKTTITTTPTTSSFMLSTTNLTTININNETPLWSESTTSEGPLRLPINVTTSSEATEVRNESDSSLIGAAKASFSFWEIIVLVGLIWCGIVVVALALVNIYFCREMTSRNATSATYSREASESVKLNW